MKRSLYILLLTISCLGPACKKEASPVTSALQDDPFVRKDNPASSIDHNIYELYQSTGLPVLYSDTVAAGPPAVLLNVGYSITGNDDLLEIRYAKRVTDVQAGIDFVRTLVLPRLGAQLKPYSILLVDSILLNYYLDPYSNDEYFTYTDVYQGFRALMIGGMGQLRNMQPAERQELANRIFHAILLSRVKLTPAINDFYAVSKPFYGRPVTGDEDNGYNLPYQQKEYYGFLTQGDEGSSYYRNPYADQDLDQFLDKVLAVPEEDFQAAYGAYPQVISKYTLLKKIVTGLGFKFN